jgi:hypothetical protein
MALLLLFLLRLLVFDFFLNSSGKSLFLDSGGLRSLRIDAVSQDFEGWDGAKEKDESVHARQ